MNISELLKNQVSDVLVKQASTFLGESNEGVSKAINELFPKLLDQTIKKAEEPDGAQKIFDMASEMDTNILDNIEDIFSGGAGNIAKLMNSGSGILNLLLGTKTENMIDSVTELSGLKRSATSSLVKMSAPFLMSVLGKQIKEKGLDLISFKSLLENQEEIVKNSIPNSISESKGESIFAKAKDSLEDLVEDTKSTASNISDSLMDKGEKLTDKIDDVLEDSIKSDGNTVKGLFKFIIPSLIVIALLSFILNKSCSNNNDMNSTESISENSTTSVDESSDNVSSPFNSLIENVNSEAIVLLAKIQFAPGSVGQQFFNYIENGFKGEARFKFNKLKFESNNAKIDQNTTSELDNFASILKAYPDIKISIDGYTDDSGESLANKQLSKARANAVKARLIAQDISPERIITYGYGEGNPIADNKTEEGKAKNSRIEIKLMQ